MTDLSFIEIEKRKRMPPAFSEDADASTVMSAFLKSAVQITQQKCGNYIINVGDDHDQKTFESRCLARINFMFEGVRFVTELDAVLAMINACASQTECDEYERQGNILEQD